MLTSLKKVIGAASMAFALFVFGFMLIGNPVGSMAAENDKAFDDKGKFENFDDLDKDKLARLALNIRGMRFDLEDLLKDRQRVDHLFDSDVNKGFLKRQDIVQLRNLNELLLKEADERLFDLDDIDFEHEDFFDEDIEEEFKDDLDDRDDDD
ncbi:MAG: hypothetical protein AAGU11_21765 [Syntrophobacteraceae bacterium]